MNASIAALLSGGSLPFTGRVEEIGRILDFWRETFTSSRLRALLMIGEAGIGKSSLIEQAAGRVESEGGTTIRINLYPEAELALPQILARSLWLVPESRVLLRSEPEGSIPAVVTALRRIIRLRPTLLIIDSIHLLDRNGLAALSALTYALAEEPLSLLAAMRPVTTEIRAVLEGVLSERMTLKGLSQGEIASLSGIVLGAAVSDEVAARLHKASHGNPLAFRSALRGAVTSGTIALSRPSNTWMVQASPAEFLRHLTLDVGTLSAGMTVHLSDAERHAAEDIASLGEAFSMEAAEAILGDRRHLLSDLRSKGIVIPVDGTDPLPGSTGRGTPLSFSHSLLHGTFVAASTIDPARLIAVITADHPIYSIFPYRLIAEAEIFPVTAADLAQLLQHAIDTAGRIDHTIVWRLAAELCNVTETILERYGGILSPEERDIYHLRLLTQHTYVLRRNKEKPEFKKFAAALRAATEDPHNEEIAFARLPALIHYLDGFNRSSTIQPIDQAVRAEIEALIERYPQIRTARQYLHYLTAMTRVALSVNDDEALHYVARLFDAAMQDPNGSEEFRFNMLGTVGPRILAAFNNRAELDERMKLLRQLEQSELVTATTFPRLKAMFLLNTLQHKESFAEIEKVIPDLVKLGMWGMRDQWLIARLEILNGYGKSLDTIEQEIIAICSRTPPGGRDQLRLYAGHTLAVLGTVSGSFAWTIKIIEEYIPQTLPSFAFQTVATLANRGETIPLQSDLDSHPEVAALFRLIAGDSNVETEDFIQCMRDLRTKDLLREGDLTFLQILIGLMDLAVEKNPEARPLRDLVSADIGAAIVRALERLDENQIFAWMRSLLERGAGHLSSREIKRWRARIAELESSWVLEHPLTHQERIVEVSMFGKIETKRLGEEPKPVRGTRLRMLLGLMVANQALDQPLSLQEFCAITEGDIDLERAKNNLHVGIHRLREALGREAIITDQGVPRLNPNLVGVDLTDARQLLEEARTALRKEHLVRAWSALSKALEITRGETPYPSLYSDFFEASRQDFELYLRRTTIAVAQAFLQEDDAASAAKVLSLASASMPGDEEIVELLAEALINSGRRAEAERIRLRGGAGESMSD